MPVHAPYNFVPLSKKVFFPDWAHQVSHDIPFSDGISGVISCTLTNLSPLYVRNGGNWTREEIMANTKDNPAQAFFRVGADILIPGTSLKGMLRNVIEIASFGKLGRIDDHRYSFRDLSKRHPYLKLMRNAKAGWLTQDKETRTWFLTPCSSARVDHNDLIKYDPKACNIKLEQIAKSKYSVWTKSLEVQFDLGKTTLSGIRAANLGAKSASTTGTIVFTGQPSANDGPKKKHLEFIFYAKTETKSAVRPELMREIEFIHAESEDWLFHKERGVIPVFYHGSANAPDSIGIAMMYRLPYRYTIHDAIRHIDKLTGADHFHPDPDLAETIFGFAGEPEGLKGRIFISPATARRGSAQPDARPIHTILGTPKPTYYPCYMEQKNLPHAHTTLMDDSGAMRGWKRYPTRTFNEKDLLKPTEEQLNVSTKFIPLAQGAVFDFSIRVHNLKPAELGALIWALAWGGNKELCHSLGMAKSFGLGQVKISINQQGTQLRAVTGETVLPEGLHSRFEELMTNEVAADWHETNQITQLLGMAKPANANGKVLQHMTIAPNQFSKEKNALAALAPHIPFAGQSDQQRFKDLQPRPPQAKALPAKKATPPVDPVKAAVQQLEKVQDWGSFKQQALENEILIAAKEKQQVSQAVFALAQRLKIQWKAKWDAERDLLIADWLQPSGLVWPPSSDQTTAPAVSSDAGAELERIKAITKWADYLAAPAEMGILSKNGLKQLREKLKAWGCDAKDAKQEKKKAWEEILQRMKS